MQARGGGLSSYMNDGDVYDVVVDQTVAAEPILLQLDEIENLTAAAKKVVEAQTLMQQKRVYFLGLSLNDFISHGTLNKDITVSNFKNTLFQSGVSFEEWWSYFNKEPKPFNVTFTNKELKIGVNGKIEDVVSYFLDTSHDVDNAISSEQHKGLQFIVALITSKLGFVPQDNVEIRSLEIRRMRQYTLNEKGFETEILTFVPKFGNSPDTSYIMQRKDLKSEPLSLDGKPHVDGQGVPGTGHSEGNSFVNFVVTLGHSGTQVYPLQGLQWSSKQKEQEGFVVDPSELQKDKAREQLNAIINTNAIPHCAPGNYTQSDVDMPPDRFMIRLSCKKKNLITLVGRTNNDTVSNVRWLLRF